jgi:CHAD domain-containing protein
MAAAVGAEGDERDTRLHDARRAYKRARYAAEALAGLGGRPARRLAKRLGALQDVLGTHHDAVVTADLLRGMGMRAHLAGENAFTYGVLQARQAGVASNDADTVAVAAKRAHRRRLRAWLGRG